MAGTRAVLARVMAAVTGAAALVSVSIGSALAAVAAPAAPAAPAVPGAAETAASRLAQLDHRALFSAERWADYDWVGLLERRGLPLLGALVVLVVGMWLAKRLSAGLQRVLGRAKVDTILATFLRNVAYAAMLVLVVVTALSAVGIPTTSMFAVLGAAGLAVGLALKDSLSNIAAGVMLIVLRPFHAGDHVIAAGQEGIVLEVRVFQTRIRAFDQRVIILPNSEITTAPIINYSTLPTRRMDITVGVGYDDDLKKAQAILLQIMADNPKILADPAPFVQVDNLGESTIDLKVFGNTNNGDFGSAKSEVIEAIRNQLVENGLSIPYPQRDLHVYHHDADGRPLLDIVKAVTDDGDLGEGKPSVG